MSKRSLNSEEHSLWKHVARSVTPLRKRKAASEPELEPAPPQLISHKPKPRPKPVTVAPPVTAWSTPGQQPAVLGRKARRRLARGSDTIDSRLDLHGMTQAEAHDALRHFLRRSRAQGARMVLLITGKGGGARGDSYGERGVLKRQVPMWLRLPEFREFVVGFETAGVRHGGEGAIYVRLRSPRT